MLADTVVDVAGSSVCPTTTVVGTMEGICVGGGNPVVIIVVALGAPLTLPVDVVGGDPGVGGGGVAPTTLVVEGCDELDDLQ